MARLAIILYEGSTGPRERRLGHVLDFFGVPWKAFEISELRDIARDCSDYAAFGSIRLIAAALDRSRSEIFEPTAVYAFVDDEKSLCIEALQLLFVGADLSLRNAPTGNVSVSVSDQVADLAGPLAGLKFSLTLGSEDTVLTGALARMESMCTAVILAEGAPLFVQFHHSRFPIFFCTSSQVIDIDKHVGQGFYDVKDHFCSSVPLVMFVKFMFPNVAWKPQELGACLIIDDPLLRPQYGFCNFARLRDLMQTHGFTTNIAFIPWNWRRTSSTAGEFFSSESELFSVSIHGCDHTAGEFGATSSKVLHASARLAQSRMESHELRTGIQHDSVMIFPQGVFSSVCPEVLKHNNFLAIVNTETVPVDSQNARTRIRDVWDVAIMAYDSFPIFTRRYAFHGLENFAFDLLLGKPCLIVAHHEVFKDGGSELIGLIDKLGSLNCCLRWRSLGEVIRRACRRRTSGIDAEEVEMYGNELVIGNPSDRAIEVIVRKKRSENEIVSEIQCDKRSIIWAIESDSLVFDQRIGPHSEKRFRVVHQEPDHGIHVRRAVRYELSVALRRIFSEIRDNYLAKSRFLSAPADRLKGALRKAI